jgi:hypothetical protein
VTDKKHRDHNLYSYLSRMHDGQIFEYVLNRGPEELKHKEHSDPSIQAALEDISESASDKKPASEKSFSHEGIELISMQNQSVVLKSTANILDMPTQNLHEVYEFKKQLIKKRLLGTHNSTRKNGKDADIDFAANKQQDEEQFVFSIFKKRIKYDGEDAYIVYFKDVTFGVLYEQIKA